MEQIGKALREARLKKGLTPEEVAKATRMRVDWVTDLEEERYQRFPTLGYARNFQILYAKYLEIDIRTTVMVDPGRAPIKTSFDHLYDGITPVGYRGIKRRQPIKRSRWLAAIIVFVIASVVGTVTALIILDILRLPSWEEMMGEERVAVEERVVVDPVIPEPTPEPTPSPTPEPESVPLEVPPRAFELFPPSAELRELCREFDPLWPRPAEPLQPKESEAYWNDAEALATPFQVASPDADDAPEAPAEPEAAGGEPAAPPEVP